MTGKATIRVQWLDVNKGDEMNPEYKSRLAAMEIKKDGRMDLLLPLEAKKLLFAFAITEGYGYER